jgi:predicted DNA-binding transcriptional regulator AlpA
VQLDPCPTNVTQCPNDARSDTDHLITADEVRRLAGGISDMTLWRWLRRGILPQPLHIERRRYWWRSAIITSLNRAGQCEDGAETVSTAASSN